MTKDKKAASKARLARQADFEKTLDKLEKIIAALEEGNLPLEESIKRFEEGMALLKDCRETLNQTEQKVRVLVKKNHELQTENFEDHEDEQPLSR